jgi:hypothetical protein
MKEERSLIDGWESDPLFDPDDLRIDPIEANVKNTVPAAAGPVIRMRGLVEGNLWPR